MIIHQNFTGGNITIVKRDGNTFYLDNQLRDTVGDWFYWAFCVEDAEEGEFIFRFTDNRIGYWGPAVSKDLKEWHWLDACDGESFKYSFAKGEKIYFAHHMLYHPDRFLEFSKENNIQIHELCKSQKGRSVPCAMLGNGEISVILTARHHACESTGSYVLEGVLKELLEHPHPSLRVFCVPFVDYDGVIDGDQGKSRAPHDHNRDYTDSPIYPEVAEIMNYVNNFGCDFGCDFHSPWHKGGENDCIFVVRNSVEKQDKFDIFSAILESEITENSMIYLKNNDHQPFVGWNQPSPNFACVMNSKPKTNLAFTLESAYFGTEKNKVSQARLLELGRCFARAMKKYI